MPIDHTQPCLDVQHCLPPEVKIGCTICGSRCNNTSVRSTGDQPKSIADRQHKEICLWVLHHGTHQVWYWLLPFTPLFAAGKWQRRMSQLHSGGYGESHVNRGQYA
ncbi:hypothetical protein O181_076537 [Austropuccinia psidii MF-1]|uniref:Uncharacterized protein n=1 Tax=Austropuccinia psidii MF-1 TaxID=1389203 RepID=A0A9Q3FH17_9BASI|nr:hypothetical protein [Austropuccinia psidii MF-1]